MNLFMKERIEVLKGFVDYLNCLPPGEANPIARIAEIVYSAGRAERGRGEEPVGVAPKELANSMEEDIGGFKRFMNHLGYLSLNEVNYITKVLKVAHLIGRAEEPETERPMGDALEELVKSQEGRLP